MVGFIVTVGPDFCWVSKSLNPIRRGSIRRTSRAVLRETGHENRSDHGRTVDEQRKEGEEERNDVDGISGSESNDEVDEKKRRRYEPARLTLDQEIYGMLIERAKQYDVRPSKLAEDILVHYLAEMRRVIFGDAQATTMRAVRVPQDARQIDAAIFTMDGVVFDTFQHYKIAAIQVFSENLNLHARIEDVPDMMEVDPRDWMTHLAERLGVRNFDTEEILVQFIQTYIKGYALPDVLQPTPGAFSLVHRARDLGLKTALLTTAPTEIVRANMKAVALDDNDIPFDSIVSLETCGRNLARGFQQVLREIDVESKRAVFVHFQPHRIQAAKALGMRCVAIRVSSLVNTEELLDYGADLVRNQTSSVTLEDLLGRQIGDFRQIPRTSRSD
uniref:Uncharacterized protein n=1 Tax=Compsopogon caeruleus TaxID=31354 RepID=A0A7S1THK8_9RHOD|mmetsp:Transcript_6919/g.14294  ORF Transcript_6919/g.14294 Transcript_6919/m.14294 type:complete len:387 (+) Transcript_6919:44-1204(+)